MYAMMLVPGMRKWDERKAKWDADPQFKGADLDLPATREAKLEASSPKLKQWGDRLSSLLSMSDAELEAVQQAIEQGVAIDDPNFPPFQGLGLRPQKQTQN